MKLRLFGLLLSLPCWMQAQHVQYSEPESQDSRKTDFQIIGRVSGNILIYKSNHNEKAISVYTPDMKLVKRVPIEYMADRIVNVDFIQFTDSFYLICEYTKKNIDYLVALKMDGMAREFGNPIELDTTAINASASGKIYTLVVSDDKQYVMALKINTKNPRSYIFTSFLFNKEFDLLDRHRMFMDVHEHMDMFTNFELDNEGQLVFTRFARSNSGEYISHISLITKAPQADTFAIRDIGANDHVLDEMKIKIDNTNKRYLISAFYYKQRKGNIEGLYTMVWDKTTDSRLKETLTLFNDELRNLAKSSESNDKMAFNDYFIKNLIVRKDGGYLVLSESEFITSRGSTFSRSDYMYGPSYPMGYYSPYYNSYSPYYPYGSTGVMNRYNAENILVLSFDKNSNLEWTNVVPKSQFDDDTNMQISYKTMNTGGELHFLYNQYDRKTLLLTDQSISPDGKITRYPTMHNLDKGFEFLPRYAKQITGNQIVIPCLYRNYLCFAKIDF